MALGKWPVVLGHRVRGTFWWEFELEQSFSGTQEGSAQWPVPGPDPCCVLCRHWKEHSCHGRGGHMSTKARSLILNP